MPEFRYYFFWLLLLCVSPTLWAALPISVEGQQLPSLAPMLERVTPAVVNISSARTQTVNNPLFNDPFFRHFFNIPQQKIQSRGSGVVIDASKGLVVTNHHVVDEADKIVVLLRDGRKFNAQVVGTDPETDIALLKIPPQRLTDLPVADSDSLRVGDFVVAIGNPFGLGQTVTSGIVSALGRTGLGIEGYEDFIQTDASINPGNSGGALVDLRGQLVGINTAILAPSGGNVGISFAIPTNMMTQVVQQLTEFGEVRRGVLGIRIQDLTPELAKAFNLKDKKGAVISEIEPGSPAAEAGLQPGDIIITVNGQSIQNSAQLRTRIGLLRIGDSVKLSVLRQGRTLHLVAQLADHRTVEGRQLSLYFEGATLEEGSEGIILNAVAARSVAWKVGLRAGDVIIGVGRQQVATLSALKRVLSQKTPPLALRIQRNNEVLTLIVQ